jgi:hypothetical protein
MFARQITAALDGTWVRADCSAFGRQLHVVAGRIDLVKERMGRGKPIRWSADGANLLLQVRCAVLDARLDKLFREWYPRFQRTPWTVGLRGHGRMRECLIFCV